MLKNLLSKQFVILVRSFQICIYLLQTILLQTKLNFNRACNLKKIVYFLLSFFVLMSWKWFHYAFINTFLWMFFLSFLIFILVVTWKNIWIWSFKWLDICHKILQKLCNNMQQLLIQNSCKNQTVCFFTCITADTNVTRCTLTNINIDLVHTTSMYTGRTFTFVYIFG